MTAILRAGERERLPFPRAPAAVLLQTAFPAAVLPKTDAVAPCAPATGARRDAREAAEAHWVPAPPFGLLSCGRRGNALLLNNNACHSSVCPTLWFALLRQERKCTAFEPFPSIPRYAPPFGLLSCGSAPRKGRLSCSEILPFFSSACSPAAAPRGMAGVLVQKRCLSPKPPPFLAVL